MWAEVTATFKKDLPLDTQKVLADRIGLSAPLKQCVSLTSLAGLPLIVGQVSFAKLSNSAVRLYFRDEARVIKIHIESVTPQNLKAIRRETLDAISEMNRLGDKEKSPLEDFRVIIGTMEGDLQEARRLGFLKRLRQSATENIATKIYVPIATFVATLLLQEGGADIKKAAMNMLVAIIATLLWVLIDATFFRSEIKYSEV